MVSQRWPGGSKASADRWVRVGGLTVTFPRSDHLRIRLRVNWVAFRLRVPNRKVHSPDRKILLSDGRKSIVIGQSEPGTRRGVCAAPCGRATRPGTSRDHGRHDRAVWLLPQVGDKEAAPLRGGTGGSGPRRPPHALVSERPRPPRVCVVKAALGNRTGACLRVTDTRTEQSVGSRVTSAGERRRFRDTR